MLLVTQEWGSLLKHTYTCTPTCVAATHLIVAVVGGSWFECGLFIDFIHPENSSILPCWFESASFLLRFPDFGRWCIFYNLFVLNPSPTLTHFTPILTPHHHQSWFETSASVFARRSVWGEERNGEDLKELGQGPGYCSSSIRPQASANQHSMCCS